MKKKEFLSKKKWIIGFLLLLLVGSSVYLFFLRENTYVSSATLLIKTPQSKNMSHSRIDLLISKYTSGLPVEVATIKKYISSESLFNVIKQHKFMLRDDGQKINMFTHLGSHVSASSEYSYYKNSIEVLYEPGAGLVHIKLNTVNPVLSHKTLALIVEMVSNYSNQLSLKIQHSYLAGLEQATQHDRDVVYEDRKKLSQLISRHGRYLPNEYKHIVRNDYARLEEKRLMLLHGELPSVNGMSLQSINNSIDEDQRFLQGSSLAGKKFVKLLNDFNSLNAIESQDQSVYLSARSRLNDERLLLSEDRLVIIPLSLSDHGVKNSVIASLHILMLIALFSLLGLISVKLFIMIIQESQD